MSTDTGSDSRTRLLESALLLFAERNYEGVGVREIATKAGINPAMVNYYFGGKAGLYVEAMRWVHEVLSATRPMLPPLPDPTRPDARRQAVAALKGYLRIALEQVLIVHGFGGPLPIPPEVAQAAHTLWNREIERPCPLMKPLVQRTAEPFQAYLAACLRILRPDLSEEGLWLMGLSIQGQLRFLHCQPQLTNLERGCALEMGDFEALHSHFVSFSLRGLGIPEAAFRSGVPLCS